ncbi:MAG: VanZ family protein [Clostridiaceae bacterium]|nr:VanZ family protein [Clostridiaceae bacterium]
MIIFIHQVRLERLTFPCLKKKAANNSAKNVFLISLMASAGIEATQLIVMVFTFATNRCFDINDIIANTLGGLTGFMIYKNCKQQYFNK